MSWDHAGTRVIATDILVNCARQGRALRSFGAGLSRASVASEDQLTDALLCLDVQKTLAPPLKRESSGDEGGVFEEEEEEEESPVDSRQPSRGGDRKPPPPSSRKNDELPDKEEK